MPYSLAALLLFLPVTESRGQPDSGKGTLEDILRQDMLGPEWEVVGEGGIPSPEPASL